MLVASVAGIKRIAVPNQSSIPGWFLAELEEVEKEGIAYTVNQVQELLKEGCPGVHFYTLNRSRATREIFSILQAQGVC